VFSGDIRGYFFSCIQSKLTT